MLSRFVNCSTKIGQIVRFSNGIQSHTVATAYYTQISNYATDNNTARTGRSLPVLLNQMEKKIEGKSRIPIHQLKDILRRLEKHKLDDTQALKVLKCCTYNRVDTDQTDILTDIWRVLQKKNINLQLAHYNCLLQFYSIKRNVAKAQETFDDMIKAGFKADPVTYQRLLHAYCCNGNLEKAINILDMMDREKMFINEKMFNDLVVCHAICGNMQAALDTIEKMKETGFFLNFYGLEQLLRSFAKLGDIESINKTLEMFEESKVELVNRDILNVIVELAVNGHTEHIDKFLNRLQPNMELKRSLDNAIAIFVEKGQAKIVPKILASPQIDAVAKASKLIEEMVQKSSSADELNEVLKSLEAIDITLKNNLNVFKSALAGQSNDLIRAILNEMKANSLEITENSFAKLIKLESERSIEGVLDVLRSMINEFNIQPQISFIADVVLPAINAKENPLLALAKLKTINNNPPRFVIAAMVNCLNENDLQNAYKIGKNNPMFYDIDMIKRPLINAFVGSNDVKTFVQLVRLIYDSIIRVNTYKKKEDNSEFNDIEIQNHKQKFIDQILFQAISSSLESSKVLLLQAFVDEGFTISNEGAEKIKKTLKSSQIPEIGPLIENLCSGDLTLRPIENRRNQGEISLLNSSEVQNILEIKIAQGGSAAVTEKHLLYAYLREENLTEIETLLGRSKFSVSNSDYAQVIELYVKKGKLDPALSMLRRVRDNNKKFQLDAIKTARLISLMVNNNRDFSEIETILVNNSQGKAEHRIFVFERLLERLATDGNVDMVNKLYNALVKNCYIEPSIELIGYLVSVHLQRGDIDNAVAAYEKIVNEMNMTPMHMVVLNHLIRNDKIEQLQHVFDLYEKVHGQENALFRLAFAFVECGKDRQARLIFEHDQVKNISRQIYSRCKNFVQFNRLDAAKVLLKATEGIYCNRHVIYESILDIYIKQNEAEEALKLGKSYVADEDVIPKETFLNKLSTLLTKNNVKVPFAVKSKDEKKEDISQESAANGL